MGIRFFKGEFLPGHWVQLGGKFCPDITFLTSFDKKICESS